ncbi:hypothetical protein PHAVU_002G163200 [Phaseolus vulgaris]|uniref:uncharacterized protein n=1 Tax=Phaseolus vulgaris TaxID=3885 RepID=UPI0035CB5B82
MAQTINKVPVREKHLATKSSSSYRTNLWDCGSTLYDSFELNSFQRQLHSAIVNSSITRTLSMPHLPERSLHAPPHQPPPPSIAMSRKSFNFSRSFHRLIRSVFKSNNKSTTTTTTGFEFPSAGEILQKELLRGL